MMNEIELRIGNIVMYDGDIVKVIGIKQTGLLCEVWIEDIYDSVDIEELKPIKLTEDILLKCKPGYSVHVVGELDVMPYHNGDGTLSLKLGTLGHAYPYEIKHLHHWQNFYYMMEGKELEVQL